MEKLLKSMAGLPAKNTKRTLTKFGDSSVPSISKDVYEFLMSAYAPINIDHRAPHADMIKNVVLEEVRGVLNAIYR